MLICSECMEKEIEWSDGSSKYEWCDDCVPRGCSCEEENFFAKTQSDIDERDYFTFKEDIQEIQKKLEKDSKSIQIFLSKTGVTYSKEEDSYTLELNNTDYKLIDNSDMLSNDFVSELLTNTAYSLMLRYVDEKKRPYPCVEVMYLKDSYKKEKGEVFFSLYHNQYLLINEIYQNGNFNAYPIIDLNTNEIDNSNGICYDKTGFEYDSSNLDLLITNYEATDPEFIFLNKFIFNTHENIIFDLLNEQINQKEYSDILAEYNDDIGFYFEMYSLDNKNKTKEELYVQEIIKNLLMDYFQEIFKMDEKLKTELFEFLCKYHVINDNIKYSDALDSSIHYGCDCGCGGDSLTDEDFEAAGINIEKRKSLFIEIFHIAYYTIIKKEED